MGGGSDIHYVERLVYEESPANRHRRRQALRSAELAKNAQRKAEDKLGALRVENEQLRRRQAQIEDMEGKLRESGIDTPNVWITDEVELKIQPATYALFLQLGRSPCYNTFKDSTSSTVIEQFLYYQGNYVGSYRPKDGKVKVKSQAKVLGFDGACVSRVERCWIDPTGSQLPVHDKQIQIVRSRIATILVHRERGVKVFLCYDECRLADSPYVLRQIEVEPKTNDESLAKTLVTDILHATPLKLTPAVAKYDWALQYEKKQPGWLSQWWNNLRRVPS